jgi:CHASE2 domain-containing sensor protein
VKLPCSRDLINYYGPPGTIPRIPIWRLTGESALAARSSLAGKIVVIGYQSLHFARGTSAKDTFATPVSDLGMYGAEIHATIINNLISTSWLRRLQLADEMLAVLIVTIVLSSVMIRSPRPKVVGVIWFLLLTLCGVAYCAFATLSIWIAGIPAIIVMMCIGTLLSGIYFFIRSEAYRRYIDRTFAFERERDF